MKRCVSFMGQRHAATIVDTTTKAQFSLSRLSNGLRVLTTNDGSGCAGVGLFSLNATKFETAETAGAAAVLETLPLRGNALMSSEEISQTLGTLGNAFKCSNNKEAMGTLLMAPRYHARECLQLLNGMCLNPTKDNKVFDEAKALTNEKSQFADRDATRVCFELTHQAAWGGRALGNPSLPTEQQLQAMSIESFTTYHRVLTQPSRSVVAATGIADHNAFATMCAEELRFPESESGDETLLKTWLQANTSPYCGGSMLQHNTKAPESTRKFAEKNLSHMTIMFQGVPINHPDYYTVSLIQSLLGGGTSFSSGGPGKGMQTKLFREVLHREGWLNGIECISAWYSDGGIIGLYGSAPHEWVRHLLNVMLYQAASICERIDASHIEMARNQLCSQLILLGEGREQLLSDMGFNLMVHNYITTADEILAGTSSVTLEDLRRVCDHMMARPITFAVYGDTQNMPDHKALETSLRAVHRKLSSSPK
eukprot:CAMPEP_0176436766 /NCGR_PEP_ID=MMETSP0127-20121128/18181_1 /TAXON_ID=938130 /ORGANISM="Platyophrya macrostoma, Strain WH" /LENGTH=480 /DNA_ID=CAMNT_0017820183 /DNA_START=43 /DNA_END=1485 /DNA_ORIENTATION=+